MVIAEHLKNKNIAEYLLYMWQIEDIIRAFHCDFDLLQSNYLSRFDLDPQTYQLTEQWYANLCEMMITEGLQEKGHLSSNKTTLTDLVSLHHQLLHSDKYPYYTEMFEKVLPYIVELRAKEKEKGTEPSEELETCFNVLYGTMILKLKHQEISKDTQKAVDNISLFLGQLSDYFLEKDSLDLD